MEFTIAYSSKTFNGVISAGVMTVEADSLKTVKENAFGIVMKHYLDNEDEENDTAWHFNVQNLQVSVTEAI